MFVQITCRRRRRRLHYTTNAESYLLSGFLSLTIFCYELAFQLNKKEN